MLKLPSEPPSGVRSGVLQPDEIQQKLTGIFRDLFDDDDLEATPDLSAKDVDEWDSLNHVRLILTVEREFKIKFAASEVTSMKNVGDMIRLISAKTA